jgi:hypothetical protein
MINSIFEGFDDPVDEKPLCEIIKDIISDKYKKEITEIRRLLAEGENSAAKEIKNQLPAFTASGKFIGGRKKKHLAAYSYFVIPDFDKVYFPEIYIKLVAANPYTYACFKSPSGKGFKVIVKVSSEAQYHDQAFKQVCEYYENLLNLKADGRCKDISRLCFMSYDPDAYINEDAKTFVVHTIPQPTAPKNTSSASKECDKWETIFEQCKVLTDKLFGYEEGNRNNYIHLLACNTNRLHSAERSS